MCIDASAKPTFAQYRFGRLDLLATAPELVVPKDTKEGFRPFTLARRDLLSGSSTTLSFRNGDVDYEVFTQDGKDVGAGVNVAQNGKSLATIACTGDVEEHWDRLEPHAGQEGKAADAPAGGGGASPTSGGPRPDPTAGKTMAEICNDDVLLLTKYSWQALTANGSANGAFHKNCCVKGALGDDDGRCQLDWPSSDAPECGYYDELRNGLFARYGYVFKDARWQALFGTRAWYRPRADFDAAWLPKLVQANVAALKPLGCPKSATSASCARGAVRWSIALQKGAKGQMDGVQQNDVAEALKAQCAQGWSEDAATCFADGGAGCEDRLSAEQRSAAVEAIRGICPDAIH